MNYKNNFLGLFFIRVKYQGKLYQNRPHHAPFSVWLWLTPNDDMPFDFARFPKGQLWVLIWMSVKARIAYTQQMFVIRLPLDGVL